MSAVSADVRERVGNQWLTALKKVLTSMMSENFEVAVLGRPSSRGPEKTDESWSWYSQVLSIAPASTIWVGAPDETWASLGKSLLTSLGIEDANSEDIQSTCTDIVAQSNAVLAQELTKRIGVEITCGAVVPSDQPDLSQSIVLSVTAVMLPHPINITLSFEESIFNSFARLNDSEPPELPRPSRVPGPISDLLLEMHATLGRTELRLDSILKLNIGSVIDIGQSITDLVDVVANGKVIARGQVVAFRGNYAIKVVSNQPKAAATNRAVFHGISDDVEVDRPAGDRPPLLQTSGECNAETRS
jgi:flagellar motor switch protein FliN/FliY